MILRLWRDWCRLWPEQYGHESLQVKEEGYDPVFDIIPIQAYKDFYMEVVRGHPVLKALSVFDVIDTALNQTRAPESSSLADGSSKHAPARAQAVSVELEPEDKPADEAETA